MKKLLNIFVMLIGLAPFVVGFYFFAVDTDLPLTQSGAWGVELNGDLVPKPDVVNVEAGSSFTVWRYICVSRDTFGEVHRQFVNGLIYSEPDTGRWYPKGCYPRVTVISVPSGLPSGDYQYLASVTVAINPFVKGELVFSPVNLRVKSKISANKDDFPDDMTGE
jgi:hypothetical protein